uniref:Glycine rich protein n=1 Tax=Heterorhabditis bacteriophora TaxID=37862 RepID=A0A1I7WQ43_HETBA
MKMKFFTVLLAVIVCIASFKSCSAIREKRQWGFGPYGRSGYGRGYYGGHGYGHGYGYGYGHGFGHGPTVIEKTVVIRHG